MKRTKLNSAITFFAMLCVLASGVGSAFATSEFGKLHQSESRPLGGVLYYHIKELGTLGGNSSFARAVNNDGQITGNANVPNGRLHAYLWENGVMQDLGFLQNGVEFSRGFYLNSSGVVTGESDNNSSKTFIFDPSVGVMTALSGLITSNPDNMNIAGGFGAGINDDNVIVGSMTRFLQPSGSVVRGFVFDSGTVRDLGSIDGNTNTFARAWGISNGGVAVGVSRNINNVSHATRWENGTATDLGSLGGELAFSEAFRLNENGQIVGRSTVTAGVTGQNAVVWENGTIRSLGRLAGVNFGRANDINEHGFIVGTSSQFEGFSGRAVVWNAGENAPTDLNTLLPDNSGWTLLTAAEGVNDHGQIAGFGTIDGRTRAFLITPFDVALQDDRRGVTILMNSSSGDYRIIDCNNGIVTEGRAEIESNHCAINLRHRTNNADQLRLTFNTCQGVGSATVRASGDVRPITFVDTRRGTRPVSGACS